MKRKSAVKSNFWLLLCLAVVLFAAININIPKPHLSDPKPTPIPTSVPTQSPTQIPTQKTQTNLGLPITWNQRKLALSDFLASPKKNSDRTAESKVGIIVSWLPIIKSHSKNGDQFTCVVTTQKFQSYAQFVPKESWIILGSHNDYILRHEQLHFDISEIYARKLRAKSKEILAMTETASANEVNAACQAANGALSARIDPIINEIDRLETDMQAQLDSNPDNLDAYSHVNLWETKIHSLL